MMHSSQKMFLVVIGLSALIGCDGGSTIAPSDTGDTGSGNLATITTENATEIAGVAAQTALENDFFVDIVSQSLPVLSSGSQQTLSSVSKMAGASNLLAVNSGLVDCAVFGTVDIDLSVADPFTLSAGDVFGFMFTSCDQGTGTVASGGVAVTITALGGDFATGEFLLGMSLEVTALSITENGETTSATGTISVEIDTTMPPLKTVTISIGALATTSAGTTDVITNMTVTITEDSSMFPTAVTVETSFTVSSPRIGGDIVVSTSIALQSSGSEYPFVGELRIMAAGNSVIILIALGGDSVRLKIDIDGDGALDDTVDTTWDEIIAAAAATG
jgi:hypothetical protein